MVEINNRLNADPGLQRAFGQMGYAEQSVVQDTLDACTSENVEQMQQAIFNLWRVFAPTARTEYCAGRAWD